MPLNRDSTLRNRQIASLPVVLLHGFMGFGNDWSAVGDWLARRGVEWLAPDLPGHGNSLLLPARQSYATWGDWLAKTLDERGLKQVALVGYSLGGRVALAFALAYPDRVGALVLVSANPGIEDEEERATRRRADDERAAFIRSQGMEAFLSRWYSMPLFASLHSHTALIEHIMATRAGQNTEAMAEVISAMSPGRQPSLWHDLPKLTMPSLWLAGALDPKYPKIAARAAKAANGRLLIVPSAGHNIPAERPRCLAAALLAFLNTHSTKTTQRPNDPTT